MKVTVQKVDVSSKPVKREILVFAITLIGFFFVFLKSCYFPSTDAITKVQMDIKDAQEIQASLEKEPVLQETGPSYDISRIKDMNTYDNWAKKLAEAPDLLLMKEFANPNLLKDLELTNIELSEPLHEDGVLKQEFVLFLDGSFLSLGHYLHQLENLPILIITNSIVLDVTNESFGRVNAEIQGVAYGWQ